MFTLGGLYMQRAKGGKNNIYWHGWCLSGFLWDVHWDILLDTFNSMMLVTAPSLTGLLCKIGIWPRPHVTSNYRPLKCTLLSVLGQGRWGIEIS